MTALDDPELRAQLNIEDHEKKPFIDAVGIFHSSIREAAREKWLESSQEGNSNKKVLSLDEVKDLFNSAVKGTKAQMKKTFGDEYGGSYAMSVEGMFKGFPVDVKAKLFKEHVPTTGNDFLRLPDEEALEALDLSN